MPDIQPITKWPHGFAYEEALNRIALADSGETLYSDEDLSTKFGLNTEQIEEIRRNPLFNAEVGEIAHIIKQDNGHIKHLVSAQMARFFEELVPTWLYDEEFPPSEKVKLLQLYSKITGLEVDKTAIKAAAEIQAKQNTQTPTLNIVFKGGAEPKTIDTDFHYVEGRGSHE